MEELSQDVDFQISGLEQQGNLQRTVDLLLHSDDKLLSSLQKLGWELDIEDTEEQENVGRLRETCARLIKCIVETIRTRLDRLYLEALGDASRSGKMVQAAAEDVAAAREELESLYAEILPVAQISVEQQYLEPALKSLSGQNGQRVGRSIEATRYVSSVLRPPSARIAIYLFV